MTYIKRKDYEKMSYEFKVMMRSKRKLIPLGVVIAYRLAYIMTKREDLSKYLSKLDRHNTMSYEDYYVVD